MLRGNTFAYTVLSAFGECSLSSNKIQNRRLIMSSAFYYGGYGVLLIPWMGIVDAYGGRTPEYYNAFGLYLCGKHYFVIF